MEIFGNNNRHEERWKDKKSMVDRKERNKGTNMRVQEGMKEEIGKKEQEKGSKKRKERVHNYKTREQEAKS